jgi:hypothetical protein
MSIIFSTSAFTAAHRHRADVIIDPETHTVVRDRNGEIGRIATKYELAHARINARDDEPIPKMYQGYLEKLFPIERQLPV